MITWENVKDFHCKGKDGNYHAWIRLNKDNTVNSLYIKEKDDEDWFKFFPENEETKSIIGMFEHAEIMLESIKNKKDETGL